MTDFFLLGALNVYRVPAAMDPETRPTALRQHAAPPRRRSQGRFDIIFIDSLTSFVSQVPEAATLAFLTGVKEFVRRRT